MLGLLATGTIGLAQTPPTPLVPTGLRSWYRADTGVTKDASNRVSQWADLSGNGFDLVSAGIDPLWVGAAMYGQPAVQFDGLTHLKTASPVDETAGGSDVTIIAVAVPGATQPAYSSLLDFSSEAAHGFVFGQLAKATNQFQLWFMDSAQSGWYSGPAAGALAGQVQVITVVKNGTAGASYVNGVSQGSDTVPATLLNPVAALAVGTRASGLYGYNGQIAEILVYNRALTDTERQLIETGMESRYINPDSDANGLPDAWEVRYLGHSGNDASSDPGAVGRTLLQSFQQNLSPWPAPTVPGGLSSWYKASLGVSKDAGNKVSLWADLSGNGGHVTQTPASGLQPLWVASAAYGEPAIQFDGTTYLKSPAALDLLSGSSNATVITVVVPGATQPAYASLVDLSSDTARGFVVGQLGNATNQFQFWFTDAAQTGWYSSPAAGAMPGLVQVLSVVKNGPSAASYLNGTSQGTSTVPAAMLDAVAALAVGNRASGNYGYAGQIAEVLVYNRALSDSERQQIESDLVAKYINPDSDADGLPDAWELQQLGTLAYGASDDPGAVGRTLLQSYQQGLSPWPTPLVVNGLRVWYQAGLGVTKDTNNKVSEWTDLSGHGSHVLQTIDAARRPVWVASATNAQPAVQFDGSTYLKTAAAVDVQAGSNDVTVIAVAVPGATQPAYASLVDLSSDTAHGFVVGQQGNATNQFQFWFMDSAQSGWYSGPAAGMAAGATHVLSVVKSGTTATSYLNGASQGTSAVPAAMLDPVAALAVGNRASGNYGYSGQIAEVLVYNRALSNAERQQIESALEAKYINPDNDGDGLPDAWELQQLGTLSYGAGDDPGAVGRTLLQSYQQSLSPWPAPTVASGLQAWFRGDLGITKDSSNKVSEWTDLSGHGSHVVQTGDATRQPLWVASATNAQPAVQFDGSTYLKTATAVDVQAGSNDVTVIAVAVPGATQPAYASLVDLSSDTAHGFVVGQLANATNQYQLWFMDSAQAGWNSSPAAAATAGSAQVLSVVKNGASATSYLNGTAQGTNTVPASMLNPVAALAVGNRASGNHGYAGQIAEVLVYNRALSDTERQQVEQSLVQRYLFSPQSISGLRLDLRAETGVIVDQSGLVSAWQDQSGHSNNATQSLPTSQPQLAGNVINGLPAVRFNGAGAWMSLPNLFSGATEGELFVVLKASSVPSAHSREAWSLGNNYGAAYPAGTVLWDDFGSYTQFQLGTPAQDISTYHLYNASSRANEWIARINGAPLFQSASNSVGFRSDPMLGRTPQFANDYFFNGDIVEMVAYDRVLTATERHSLESYLVTKYALFAAPNAPTNLTAGAVSSTQVSLTWQGSSGTTSFTYSIERQTGSGGYAVVAEVDNALSYFDPTAAAGVSYDYRVRARNAAGYSGYSNVAAVTLPATSPAAMPLAGMRLWLEADVGLSSGGVGYWPDQSGNHNDGYQNTGGNQPQRVANAINQRPVVRFSHANDNIQLPNFMTGATGAEVFFVLRTDAAASPGAYTLWNAGGAGSTKYPFNDGTIFDSVGANQDYHSPIPAQDLWAVHIYNVSAQSGAWVSRINGTNLFTANANSVAFNSSPMLGYSGSPVYGTAFQGDIAEIMVYDHALSDAERAAVYSYLNLKYFSLASFYGDGATDLLKRALGLDPYNPDNSGDGLPDGWEITHGLDPTADNGTGSPAGDGVSNFTKYQLDLDPRLAAANDPAYPVKLRVYSPQRK